MKQIINKTKYSQDVYKQKKYNLINLFQLNRCYNILFLRNDRNPYVKGRHESTLNHLIIYRPFMCVLQ